MADKFSGFLPPTENYSKLPHQMIDALPLVETVSEMKVILYILRHTWGFQDQWKKITLDEFEHGRKNKKGDRLDAGVGLSIPSIRDGLKRAEEHGFILVETDDRDKARVKKFYSLAMAGDEPLQSDCKSLSPTDKNLSSGVKDSDSRSEKETFERNSQKETEKETTDVSQEQIDEQAIIDEIADDFLNKPSPEDLARRTAAARAAAGGNWADAGEDGADVAETALARFCDMQGEAPNDDERQSMLRELAEILKPLRVTVDIIDNAFDIMVEDFGYRVGNYNVFQDSFKRDMATCIRRARGKKQPAQPDRAARYDTPAVRASQAALAERMAARDPPVEDDRIGAVIKDQLRPHMSRVTFETWVKPTTFVCDDGALVVTAINALTRDWLESHTGEIIERVLPGFADGPQEIRFEIQEGS